MADDTRATDGETPGAAAKEAAKSAKKADDATYSRERLIEEAGQFFGQPSHVVAGAIASIPKKSLTTAEVEAAVKAFLSTEVK